MPNPRKISPYFAYVVLHRHVSVCPTSRAGMFTWPSHAAPYISGQGVQGASDAAGTDTGGESSHTA